MNEPPSIPPLPPNEPTPPEAPRADAPASTPAGAAPPTERPQARVTRRPHPNTLPPATTPRTSKSPAPSPDDRRDFFSDALKEVMFPFAGLIERRIQPLLNALESIPDKAGNFALPDPMKALGHSIDRALDQPLLKNVALPQVKKPKQIDRYLRPPGALPVGQFESSCSQCGACVDACPAEAIKIDVNGLVAEGFPYIVPDDQPCVLSEGLPCTAACPTGALMKLTDMLQVKMGTAKVDHSTCLRDRGENCTLCIEACPVEKDGLLAITANPITGKIIIRKNICVGCGLCEQSCPTEPRSIIVIPNKPPRDPIIA